MAYATGTTMDNTFNSSRRIDYISDKIVTPWPNEVKFLTALQKLARKPVNTTKPTILFERPIWKDHTLYAAGTGTWSSGQCTLTVDDGSGGNINFLQNYDYLVVKSATGNTVCLVTGVSGNTLTLEAVSATPINIADNDPIQVIGEAFPNGMETAPASITGEPSEEYSYCEMFLDSIKIDVEAKAQNLYGGPEFTRLKAKKSKEHAVKINRAMIHSDRSYKTITVASETKNVKTTYGLLPFILNNSAYSNIFTPSYASYTYDDFIDDVQAIADAGDGSRKKLVLAGSNVISHFSKISTSGFWGDAQFTIPNKENNIGLNVMEITTPHDIDFQLTKEYALSPLFKDYMIVVDLDYVDYSPLVGNGENLDTTYIPDFVVTGNVTTDVIRTSAALVPRLPEMFALFKFS